MLNTKTAHELLDLINEGRISQDQILADINSHIGKVESKVKAYAHLPNNSTPTKCDSLLKGIPIAIKDNICTKGELTTCSSHILDGFKSPYDATVIEKLKANGAFVFGKTNMDEFAFGSSCETSFYGPTHNPWDLDRVPGGSSGGSAAAVAADEAIWALGSDTGGSIRQPASLCGVVGLKPTYGRVSRYGLIAFASSLDQIGPITKDVEDSALLLSIIAGHDEKDSTSADIKTGDYLGCLKKDVKGMKIAIPKEYFVEGLNKEVEDSVADAKNTLKKLGATFKEVSLPHTKYAVAVYYILATAEASSNLARFDGVQYGFRDKDAGAKDETAMIASYRQTRGSGFGLEAKRRIILGTYVLSSGYYDAYYLRAQKVRTLIKKDFDQLFKEFDCALTPTSPTPAFKIEERLENPLSMYLSDIYTISANLAGVPGISLPCGLTKDNLPIGLQILSAPFKEENLFRAAYAFEQNTKWHKMKAKI